MKSAIIDLGTNTFHLLVFDGDQILVRSAEPVRLGKEGISSKIVSEAAQERALKVLKKFRQELDQYNVKNDRVYAFGTSALRSAKNTDEFLELIRRETDINVEVIYGFEEADLIYKGVKQAVDITTNSLIVDIGGGSTEFVICNEDIVLWKESLEIGGQRLLEDFIKNDPPTERDIQLEMRHLNTVLEPVFVNISKHNPEILIGSGGSFTTLKDIIYYQSVGKMPPGDLISYQCNKEDIDRVYEELLTLNKDERAKIPGLPLSKVDVIVPVLVLIKMLVERLELTEVVISEYSLKEGAMLKLKENA